MSTYRLGAIELIELGATRRHGAPRIPFLSNRHSRMSGPRLGQLDFLKDVGSFLTGAFEFVFKTLASLVNVPLDLASKGIGVLFDGVAGLLKNVPIIGEIAAELLLVGKSVLQWGLSVPGMLLSGVGNVFGEIKKAIDATKTSSEKKADEDAAKKKILDKAQQKGGEPLKAAVSSALNGEAPAGATNVPPQQQLPPGAGDIGKSDLDRVLEIGLPVAGAAALAFLVVS